MLKCEYLDNLNWMFWYAGMAVLVLLCFIFKSSVCNFNVCFSSGKHSLS